MGRPRGFRTDDVVAAARDLFWVRGYEATSLPEIEAATGLNRSSIYQAFGSKRGIFDAALRDYLRQVAEPRLAGLLADDAGLDQIVDYFDGLGSALRTRPKHARRGCLMVNTIAELGAHDRDVEELATAYRRQIGTALGSALRTAAQRGHVDPGSTAGRAGLLTAAVTGILLTARLSPAEAADLADATAGEVRRWRTAA